MKKIVILLLILCLASCSERKKVTNNFESLPLPKYSETALLQDFDILVNSLKEAHTGIYWYTSPEEFDKLVQQQRLKIKDSLNGLEFYNIAAPIVAFTKEDHCDISVSEEVAAFTKEKGKFMPLSIINLKNKPYILNDPDASISIIGWQLLKINNVKIEDIYSRIFATIGADGYIEISKYRALDAHRLAVEYARVINQPDAFTITALNPKTGETKELTLKAIAFDKLKAITKSLVEEGIIKQPKVPASLDISNNTATLILNTFLDDSYEEAGMDFKKFIKHSFETIKKTGIQNLIIDVRENGGGTEGNEDYLFSFLTNKPYTKYKYVQVSALQYSFYQYTDYKEKEDYQELEADLAKEHQKSANGRFLRKPRIEQQAPLQPNPFRGQVYVLTSGWTYSGGAEFCSLMKGHTNAVFIGEEVGGGFYGNTSGYGFELTLPNSGLVIDVPVLKFVLDVKKNIPKGRGVIPDYEVQPTIEQFMNGKDVEMEFAKTFIKNTHLDINH
ncbi:S41 family peptidase [Flavobacterium hauense]